MFPINFRVSKLAIQKLSTFFENFIFNQNQTWTTTSTTTVQQIKIALQEASHAESFRRTFCAPEISQTLVRWGRFTGRRGSHSALFLTIHHLNYLKVPANGVQNRAVKSCYQLRSGVSWTLFGPYRGKKESPILEPAGSKSYCVWIKSIQLYKRNPVTWSFHAGRSEVEGVKVSFTSSQQLINVVLGPESFRENFRESLACTWHNLVPNRTCVKEPFKGKRTFPPKLCPPHNRW